MQPSAIQSFIDSLEKAFRAGDDSVDNKTTEKESIEILKRQYQAVGNGDFPAFAATLHDDVIYEQIGPTNVPFSGVSKGKAAFMERLTRNFSLLENQQPEVLTVVAQGDTVVVFGKEQGVFRPTGKKYHLHWVQEFTIRDGQLIRFRQISDTASLLPAIC